MDNISVAGEFGRKPALSFDGTPSDELVVEVLHTGDGQVVEAGDTITCHYYGAVFGSDVDFDNSFDRGGALSFQIGVGMVIPGWDEGLVGKRVGDRVLLSIPSELGYGERGVPHPGSRGGATPGSGTDILGLNCSHAWWGGPEPTGQPAPHLSHALATRGAEPGRRRPCVRGTRSRPGS